MIDLFMKCLYSNSLIKLGSFYDYHIEVTFCESMQGFITRHLYSIKGHVCYQLYLLEGYS